MTEEKGPLAKKLPTSMELIMAEARNEVNEETMDKYKGEIKQKLRALTQAKKIVGNIEREIEDLQVAINNELS